MENCFGVHILDISYIYIYLDDSGGGRVGGGHVGGGGVGVGGGWVIIIFQGVLTKLNLLTKF